MAIHKMRDGESVKRPVLGQCELCLVTLTELGACNNSLDVYEAIDLADCLA